MISLLFGCVPIGTLIDAEDQCFADLPEQGEVRVHRVSCSAEAAHPNIRKGDWILENHLQRFFIRELSSALTDPMAIGGSLIHGGTENLIFELRVNDLDHRSIQMETYTTQQEASVSFYDEDALRFSYRLPTQ